MIQTLLRNVNPPFTLGVESFNACKILNPSIRFPKLTTTLGFGSKDNYGGRFINRDGTFNIRREGQAFWERFSLFHSMLSLPVWKFTAILFTFFIGINLCFTLIYIGLGRDQFTGMISGN